MYIYNKKERQILKQYIDKLKRRNKELEIERSKLAKSIEKQEGLIKEIIKLEDYQDKLEEEIEDLKNKEYYTFLKSVERMVNPEKDIYYPSLCEREVDENNNDNVKN